MRSQPFLDKRTHHLLWALRRSDKRQHLAMRLFGITHPSRTRTGEHRQRTRRPTTAARALLPLKKLTRVLAQRDLPRKRRIKHMRKSKRAHRERPHASQHARKRDRCSSSSRAERGGERGEGLRRDREYGDAVPRRAHAGVLREDGEDFGVRLEGDQDGLGGSDAAATVRAWFSSSGGREREREREREGTYLHARQSFRLISAVCSFWAPLLLLAPPLESALGPTS